MSTDTDGTRFNSFSPLRRNCKAAWFVDGQDYMSAVADAIELASKEIFITDWQLSPHIYMKRPETGVDGSKWRLDKMLLRKAEKGVEVFVLLYAESKKIAGMDLGSDFVKEILKHPNIKVLLHPDLHTMFGHGISGSGLWSHHEKIVVVDQSIAFIGGIDLAFGRWDNPKHELTDNYPIHPCIKDEGCSSDTPQQDATEGGKRYQRWVGKDYGNTFQGGARNELKHPFDDYIDRNKIPRMPWHDVGCAFSGRPARDVAKHFIQRYNAIKKPSSWNVLELVDFTDHSSSLFMPKPDSNNLKIQVLRSVDQWSAEQILESSIYNAYLHSIQNAEHFVYIENQFFISSQPGMFLKVQNQILSALAERILRAYDSNQNFCIMIVMPLKPEFPGEWGEKSGKDLESVSYWNYLSLYSGNDSLYNKLKKGGIPKEKIQDYFSVYGLRTHGILNGEFVTEIVYVHSKVMIVDDQITIMGSANINDRSMLGSRDSEIAVIVEDTDMIQSTMGGKPYLVGKFAHSLRCNLMKEHLGLLDGGEAGNDHLRVDDPLVNKFIQSVSDLALKNDIAYNRVFGGRIDPTNNVCNLEQLKEWRANPGILQFADWAEEELKNIHGRLVPYPVLFLKDELKPSYLDAFGMFVDSRGVKSDIPLGEQSDQTFFV